MLDVCLYFDKESLKQHTLKTMKKLIPLFILLISFSAMAETDGCSFNFSEFHSLLEQKSKKFKNMKPESKDEISKTLTQEATLRTGEKILFVGGGCAHMGYAFVYSKVKVKGKKTQDQFKKARDLLIYTDIRQGYKDSMLKGLEAVLKNPIKKSKTDVYDLPCGDALCTLDLSQKNSMKIGYSFAL